MFAIFYLFILLLTYYVLQRFYYHMYLPFPAL
jgi:hypothetical protein